MGYVLSHDGTESKTPANGKRSAGWRTFNRGEKGQKYCFQRLTFCFQLLVTGAG